MADTKTAKNKKVSIDAEAIKQLADLFKETDLTEIEYEVTGCRIRVARTVSVQHIAATPLPTQHSAPETKVEDTPVVTAIDDLSSHPGAVKSPMVGTAYLAPQPGADPFVSIGTRVEEGQTLLIIEAMKVMNPIKAHKSGTVREIFAHDGAPVEYDELLMVIE